MSHNSAWLNLGPLFFFSFFFLLFFDISSCSLFSLFFCWKKIEASPNLTSTNRCLLNMQHWLCMRSRWFGIYWPHSFSFLWTETKLRWIKMQQRIHEWGQYLWPLKQKENFFLLDQQGKSQVGKSSHLAHTGSQSVDRICLILPACGFCHIIIMIKLCCRFKLINIPLRMLLSKIRYLHSHLGGQT